MDSRRHVWLILLACNFSFASPRYVKNQWIVRSTAERSTWADIKSEKRLRLLKVFGPKREFALIEGDRGIIKFLPRIKYIQRNFIYQVADSMDPDFEKSWGLKNTGQQIEDKQGTAGADIDAERAWDIFKGNSNIVVAVLDSGIQRSHEDLQNNLWKNPGEIPANNKDDDGNGYIDDTWGWNFIDNNNKTDDDYSHGSFCAGIIGADAHNQKGSRGVNWKTSLMAVKIIDHLGFGTSESVLGGITYAVKQGANVLNASFRVEGWDQGLYDLIQWAGTKNVLVVASAGNLSLDNDEDENPTYPASFDLPNIISVASYNSKDRLSSFSNYGKSKVDIGAPGERIFSTKLDGYRIADGTSYAAPFVTGVAALVKAYNPGLSLQEWKNRILLTSTPLEYYEKEHVATAGRVNAYNALKDIRPARPAVPTHWKAHALNLSTPHPYLNDKVESFTVQHPGANFIRVHFRNFHTEKKDDPVTLRDSEGRIVRVYSGDRGDFFSADAIGSTMHIDFKPDFYKTEYGFDIDRYEVRD